MPVLFDILLDTNTYSWNPVVLLLALLRM